MSGLIRSNDARMRRIAPVSRKPWQPAGRWPARDRWETPQPSQRVAV